MSGINWPLVETSVLMACLYYHDIYIRCLSASRKCVGFFFLVIYPPGGRVSPGWLGYDLVFNIVELRIDTYSNANVPLMTLGAQC